MRSFSCISVLLLAFNSFNWKCAVNRRWLSSNFFIISECILRFSFLFCLYVISIGKWMGYLAENLPWAHRTPQYLIVSCRSFYCSRFVLFFICCFVIVVVSGRLVVLCLIIVFDAQMTIREWIPTHTHTHDRVVSKARATHLQMCDEKKKQIIKDERPSMVCNGISLNISTYLFCLLFGKWLNFSNHSLMKSDETWFRSAFRVPVTASIAHTRR